MALLFFVVIFSGFLIGGDDMENMTKADYQDFLEEVGNSIDMVKTDIATILLVDLKPLEKLSAATHAFECLDVIFDASVAVKNDAYHNEEGL